VITGDDEVACFDAVQSEVRFIQHYVLQPETWRLDHLLDPGNPRLALAIAGVLGDLVREEAAIVGDGVELPLVQGHVFVPAAVAQACRPRGHARAAAHDGARAGDVVVHRGGDEVFGAHDDLADEEPGGGGGGGGDRAPRAVGVEVDGLPALAGEPQGGSEQRVLQEVAAAGAGRPRSPEQDPAAAQSVLAEGEGVRLAVREAPEGAVVEVEPRERRRQAGRRRRVLRRDVAPVAAGGGEASAVGEGGQAAQDDVRELWREPRPARRRRARRSRRSLLLAQPGAHGAPTDRSCWTRAGS